MQNFVWNPEIAPAAEGYDPDTQPTDAQLLAQSRHVAQKLVWHRPGTRATERRLADAIKLEHVMLARATGLEAAPAWAQEMNGKFYLCSLPNLKLKCKPIRPP